MSTIKKVRFTYKKSSLRFDSNLGKYVGYQIDMQVGGRRHRNTFRTKGEAEQFIDDMRRQKIYSKAGLQNPMRASVSLADLFTKRIAEIKNVQEVIRATRVFETFRKQFAFPPAVVDVRTAHFQIYINEREAAGVKPATINREINVLSTAFKRATALFAIELEEYDPPRIARPQCRKTQGRQRVITVAEKDDIVRSVLVNRLPSENPRRTQSRKTVALMFELAWLLGLRLGEVRRLLKSDFKPAERTLRVVRWKTETVSLMEFLPDRVIEILNEAESPTEHIFHHPCSEHTFTAIIKDACTSLGLEYGIKTLDGITFHSTRHSFTSRLVQVTDLATAKSFTGHSTADMVGWYAHASTDSRRRAMESLYRTAMPAELFLRQLFRAVQSYEVSEDLFVKEILEKWTGKALDQQIIDIRESEEELPDRLLRLTDGRVCSAN